MSLEPGPVPAPSIEPGTPVSAAAKSPTWLRKVLGLCFVIFCFEVGVCLVVFPWLNLWEVNSVKNYAPWLGDLWLNPFFRGALSGLGLVNIIISFLEIMRLIQGNAPAQRPSNGRENT